MELSGQPVDVEKTPTMKFERGRLIIFGGVNRLSGSYLLSESSVVIGDLMSTRMAGPAELMELESKFSSVMTLVDGFHVQGNDLELLSAGVVVAKFKSEAP